MDSAALLSPRSSYFCHTLCVPRVVCVVASFFLLDGSGSAVCWRHAFNWGTEGALHAAGWRGRRPLLTGYLAVSVSLLLLFVSCLHAVMFCRASQSTNPFSVASWHVRIQKRSPVTAAVFVFESPL